MPSSTISILSTTSSVESNNNNNKTTAPDQQQQQPSAATLQKLFPSLQSKLRKLLLRSDSANITTVDPIVKGTYLGNVVTTWAKGEGSLERPASALWKNHIQGRGSIRMNLRVSRMGLRAETREHGLTEYWNNRLTWCGVPKDYPKLFCWIYRHEGRKLKQELRCHAILCTKDEGKILAETLKFRLAEALFDFRKEKIQRQNARLSSLENYLNYYSNGANSVPSSESLSNYKKERSSPSKLSIIEELEGEEEFLHVNCPPQQHRSGNSSSGDEDEEDLGLPELTGIDKVIHLLEMDLRPNEYSSKKNKLLLLPSRSLSSSESSDAGSSGSDEIMNMNEIITINSPPNTPNHHLSSLYQQICYEI